jgi:hypothetical protein
MLILMACQTLEEKWEYNAALQIVYRQGYDREERGFIAMFSFNLL